MQIRREKQEGEEWPRFATSFSAAAPEAPATSSPGLYRVAEAVNALASRRIAIALSFQARPPPVFPSRHTLLKLSSFPRTISKFISDSYSFII